jgi:uncharacterized NAD(P)/FAD-binding protein YdhS
MLVLKEIDQKEIEIAEIENLCLALFNEWKENLSFQEQEIWLWNAMVGMAKIKQRRSINEKMSCG